MDLRGSREKGIEKNQTTVWFYCSSLLSVRAWVQHWGWGDSGRAGDDPCWAQPVLDTHPGHPEPQPGWQGHGGTSVTEGKAQQGERKGEEGLRTSQGAPGQSPTVQPVRRTPGNGSLGNSCNNSSLWKAQLLYLGSQPALHPTTLSTSSN